MRTIPRIGIVTTLRHAGPMLDSFIAWHRHQGFARLFLFFDDAQDPDLKRAGGDPLVAAMVHDQALRTRWKAMPEYPRLENYVDSEVMARQVLNLGLAMEMARAEDLDWLLHIDADELFFSPSRPLADIFTDVSVDALAFPNFEAVPEREDITDPFREVDLFKIPAALKPGPFTEQGLALRRATPQLPQTQYFHFYSNGKSAVRLASGLRPDGVHGFSGPGARVAESTDAFILHYACCGFDAFWDKYAALGRFADRWMDRIDIRATIGPLHLDARDMVAGGDREQARLFYCRRVMLADPVRINGLIADRVLARITVPREILGGLTRARS